MRTHVCSLKIESEKVIERTRAPLSIVITRHRVRATRRPMTGSSGYALELPHQIGRDLADAADAHQREVAVDLVAQQCDRALYASLATGDSRIEKRPADEDKLGAQR
jgi:hypothetical protein